MGQVVSWGTVQRTSRPFPRLGKFFIFQLENFMPVFWLVGRRKIILIRKILNKNPSTAKKQPKTSSADVIMMSHHRNNAYVKNTPQFRKTEIFWEPLNEFQI